jgi:DNA gyrase subunit A
MGMYLTNILSLSEGERIIYITAAGSYDGFMLFGFANGKFAKIDMAAYATKTNRKRLANAYSTHSPLIYVGRHAGDIDMAAFSSRDRALIFNTDMIGVKTTRNSMGVQILKDAKGSALKRACAADISGLTDIGGYRIKTIPAAGRYVKK